MWVVCVMTPELGIALAILNFIWGALIALGLFLLNRSAKRQDDMEKCISDLDEKVHEMELATSKDYEIGGKLDKMLDTKLRPLVSKISQLVKAFEKTTGIAGLDPGAE